MGRPRTALWESPDKAVYIARHRRGFVVVDTRGRRTEKLCVDLAKATTLATSLCATPAEPVELTFFELAVDYLNNGTTVWNDYSDDTGPLSEQPALTPDTLEDRIGRLRNHYADVGHLPLSKLPVHFIGDAVRAIRRRTTRRSVSLQKKVRLEGLAVMRWGEQNGLVPAGHDWVGPLRKVRTRKVDDRNVIGRTIRQLPSHREVHRLARYAAHDTGADYMRLFFWMLAYIGFREEELCALTVDDVVQDTRVRIHVRHKAVWRTGVKTIVEEYTKGYANRTVVVPTILERPILQRVAQVRAEGGTILFPKWTRRPGGHQYIEYSTLRDLFLRCGEKCGWRS